MLRELLQGEVDSTGAATACGEELRAECIVHQSAFSRRLRTDDGDDNNLFVACLFDDLLDKVAFELEVLTVNQLECLSIVHQLLYWRDKHVFLRSILLHICLIIAQKMHAVAPKVLNTELLPENFVIKLVKLSSVAAHPCL
jgi:hypothetical protein